MGKRGEKLAPETKVEIIRLSKEYSPGYISRHLGLHISTIRRHIELEIEAKLIASGSFQKHNEDLTQTLKGLVSAERTELMYAAFVHFTQEHPEYVHLEDSHNSSKEASLMLERMELLADSRSLRFCAKCPICQNIKKRLKESSRGVAQLFTNSPS